LRLLDHSFIEKLLDCRREDETLFSGGKGFLEFNIMFLFVAIILKCFNLARFLKAELAILIATLPYRFGEEK
jgi:hypothetical protein